MFGMACALVRLNSISFIATTGWLYPYVHVSVCTGVKPRTPLRPEVRQPLHQAAGYLTRLRPYLAQAIAQTVRSIVEDNEGDNELSRRKTLL